MIQVREPTQNSNRENTHALGTQWRIAIGDVEVQMRSGGVPGESQCSDDRSAVHALPNTYPHTAWLQVFAESVASTADIQSDIVADGVTQRMPAAKIRC